MGAFANSEPPSALAEVRPGRATGRRGARHGGPRAAAGHAFYKLGHVLLSPHSADHTPDWLDRAMRFFLEQFERFRTGAPLLNVVEKKRGY